MVPEVAIGAANFAFSVIRRLDTGLEIGRLLLGGKHSPNERAGVTCWLRALSAESTIFVQQENTLHLAMPILFVPAR